MKKVFQLIDVVDDELLVKLIYLDRLVRFYSKFLTYWKTAGVYSDGKTVMVKFMRINKYGYEGFTERVFPISSINERLASYKGKIKREFKSRHENTRIQRAKEVHKWKKFIDNAKVQVS